MNMRVLPLTAVVSLFSVTTFAESTIEHTDGRVLYSRNCGNNYVFSYFDGRRQQSLCIEDSASVTIKDFLFKSRNTDCEPQVRVVSGTVRDRRLYADRIEEVRGCMRRRSGR